MQPEPSHDAVHQVGHTGHVARVLHDPDDEEEQEDLGQEDEHAADAGDHPVSEEVAEERFRHHHRDPVRDLREHGLDEADRGVGPAEERLEDHAHEEGEHHEADHRVQHEGIEPLGPGPALGEVLQRWCGVAVDPVVAALDQRGFDLAPVRFGRGPAFVHYSTHALRHADQFVFVFEGEQRPDGQGPATVLGAARPGVRDLLGDLADVLEQCGILGAPAPAGNGTLRIGEHLGDPLAEPVHPVTLVPDHFHDRYAERGLEPLAIKLSMMVRQRIGHRERDDRRDFELHHL